MPHDSRSEARIAPARYETMRQCQAAVPAALIDATDIDAPVVSAACRATGTHMADASRPKARTGG